MSQVSGKPNLLNFFARYNKVDQKLESFDDAVSEIKKRADSTNSKVIFATAVGCPESGKTEALNRLLDYWTSSSAKSTTNFKLLRPRTASTAKTTPGENVSGIQLTFNNAPNTFGHEIVYLICLDVVSPGATSTEQDVVAYNTLVEMCYQISNLVIFTFSRKNDPANALVDMNYDRSDIFRASISISGYANWEAISPCFPNVQTNHLFNYVLHRYGFGDQKDVHQFVNALLLRLEPKTGRPLPAQIESQLKLYSNHGNVHNLESPQANIYCRLVDSIRDWDFRNCLTSITHLQSIFEKIVKLESSGDRPKQSSNHEKEALGPPRISPDIDSSITINTMEKLRIQGNVARTHHTLPVPAADFHGDDQNLPSTSNSHAWMNPGATSESDSEKMPKVEDRTKFKQEDIRFETAQEARPSSPQITENNLQGGPQALDETLPPEPVPIKPPKPSKYNLDLQIRASFKKLALSLITNFEAIQPSVATSGTTEARSFQQVQEWKQKWESLAPSAQDLTEFENMLKDCCHFFTSCQRSTHKYFESRSYLDPNQLEAFTNEVETSFRIRMDNHERKHSYLFKLAKQVMNSLLFSISSKNAAIIRSEKLLVETLVKPTLESYTATMQKLTAQRIFNQSEVLTYHKSVIDAFQREVEHKQDWIWKPHLKNIISKMEQDSTKVYLQKNKNNLTSLRKGKKPNAFEACQFEFDHWFSQEAQFTSMVQLKSHANSCRLAALEKAEIIQKNPHEFAHVQEMLRRYTFDQMLRCASSTCARAPEVLADKCGVTVVLKNGQLAELKVVTENMDALHLDPRMWLQDGKRCITEVCYAKIFERRYKQCSWPGVEDNAFQKYQDRSQPTLIPIQQYPDEVITAYFSQVKIYLLTNHHLLPTSVTLEGHLGNPGRIEAAVRLALLPESKMDELVVIETSSMFLENIMFEPESLVPPKSEVHPVTHGAAVTYKPKLEQNTDTRKEDIAKLAKLVGVLKDALGNETLYIHEMVAKQAEDTLKNAEELLNFSGVNSRELQLMISRLQIQIDTVIG